MACIVAEPIGKVLRDGQGQASGRTDREVLDLVITNALVIDWSGIFKVRRLSRRVVNGPLS